MAKFSKEKAIGNIPFDYFLGTLLWLLSWVEVSTRATNFNTPSSARKGQSEGSWASRGSDARAESWRMESFQADKGESRAETAFRIYILLLWTIRLSPEEYIWKKWHKCVFPNVWFFEIFIIFIFYIGYPHWKNYHATLSYWRLENSWLWSVLYIKCIQHLQLLLSSPVFIPWLFFFTFLWTFFRIPSFLHNFKTWARFKDAKELVCPAVHWVLKYALEEWIMMPTTFLFFFKFFILFLGKTKSELEVKRGKDTPSSKHYKTLK